MFLSTKWFDRRLNQVTNSTMFRIPNAMSYQIWGPTVFFRSALEVVKAVHPSDNRLLWIYQNNMIVHWVK